MIKESNFVENYQQLAAGMVTIPDAMLTEESAADGQPLRELVCNALRRVKPEGEAAGEVGVEEEEAGGGEGWADADWASVRAKLASVRATSGPGMVWRLALPKNHVVAVRLTADVLSACFSHLGLSFNDQMVYYREETYKPGYCAFRVGDYAVSTHARARPGLALTRRFARRAAVGHCAADQHDAVRPHHQRPHLGLEAAQQGASRRSCAAAAQAMAHAAGLCVRR